MSYMEVLPIMKIDRPINIQLLLTTSLLLMLSLPICSQTIYTINDPEELQDRTYVPGDEIVLTNGIYNTDERIDFVANGTADLPIVFRAESPGGVKFTGGLKMNIGGDYVIVDGFHWQGGIGANNFIQFRDGTDYAHHSTIRNCVIDGLRIDPDDIADDMANNSITKHRWIVLYGTYNTVINCSFLNKESAGALLLAEYEFNQESDPCGEIGHTISNNYFYKYKKIDSSLSNSGDSETIRLGESTFQQVNSNTRVFNNYFVESDGENEIISNKSKGNIYTNNTFRRCRGSLTLRHGSDVIVDGNYFLGENVDGTGGIRITDSNHTITNNYIQDCITLENQAKWNNGITFMGGNDNASVVCTSTNTTNGYQKSDNIMLSNNSIVNTNAPIFFNTDRGTTDPTGTVSDNLIYFDSGNSNLSELFEGDSSSAYEDMATSLTYTDNIYTGTTLGQTNAGFTLESDIIVNADGEIFNFSGPSSSGKGADLGNYKPSTDDMVGYGIGACFVNNIGESIDDGECTIEVIDQLILSGLSIFPAEASTYELTINSNVKWTATVNDSWISIDMDSGTGSAMISVMVTDNPETTSRQRSITFTQDTGGDDIIRTATVTQEGVDLTDLLDLINTGTGLPTDKVTVHSFSKEEVDGTDKFNYATNTLDKDNNTVWAADDGDVLAGDYRGDGEYIIYDLGNTHTINLIQFSTTNKSDAFGFQIWGSTTGTEDSDFTMILPTTGDLLLTATNTTDFNQYEIDATQARYIKLIGFGRYNTSGDTRTSEWSAIGEIEFYGSTVVSLNENILSSEAIVYPVPTVDILHVKNIDQVTLIYVYSLNGKRLLEKTINSPTQELQLDVSTIPNGAYMLRLIGDQFHHSIPFLISH